MKRCYKCGKTKEFSEFNKDKKGTYGLQGRCRDCDKEKNRKYRATHKEYFKQKSKELYKPELNPERYANHRDDFLRRRNEYAKSVKGRFVTLLYSAKTRAIKSGLEYNLDLDWLLELYKEQNKCCLLTGIELQFESHHGGKRNCKPFSPSLDRINPKLGYTKENTRLVCTLINLAMNTFGEDTFRQVAAAYLNHSCTRLVGEIHIQG